MNMIEYLARTFSQTSKVYENYVINAIWNRISCETRSKLHPITQQCVKDPSGNHYLVDLYFPQLNLGVEVDEPQHISSLKSGVERIRAAKIKKVLDKPTFIQTLTQIREGAFISENIQLFQVDENGDPLHDDKRNEILRSADEIEELINQVVTKIEHLAKNNKGLTAWNGYISAATYYKGKTEINITDIKDDVRFRDLAEIAEVLRKNDTVLQQGIDGAKKRGRSSIVHFNSDKILANELIKEYWIWPPKMATIKKGVLKAASGSDFVNVLSDDGEFIYEYQDNNKDLWGIKEEQDKNKRKRVVFMHADDPILRKRYYIFYGVFEVIDYIIGVEDEECSIHYMRGAENRTTAVYKKVDNSFPIIKENPGYL